MALRSSHFPATIYIDWHVSICRFFFLALNKMFVQEMLQVCLLFTQRDECDFFFTRQRIYFIGMWFFDRNNHTGFVMCSVTARRKNVQIWPLLLLSLFSVFFYIFILRTASPCARLCHIKGFSGASFKWIPLNVTGFRIIPNKTLARKDPPDV